MNITLSSNFIKTQNAINNQNPPTILLVKIQILKMCFQQLFLCSLPFIITGYSIPSETKNIQTRSEVAEQINQWTPDEETHPWELSGLYQGDIMRQNSKNGVINETSLWPNGLVPYVIDEEDFDETEIKTIKEGMKEYKSKTCVRFRPYAKDDKNWIIFKGNSSGCWSSVGMQEGGQIVHLQTPNCVRHGVVVHEILHALGFFHQQSASDRDEFVKINWENITPGHEHNFNKYNTSVVTDYGVSYDYGSVMHYSGKAFSKNDEPTIVSLVGFFTFLVVCIMVAVYAKKR